VKLSSVLVVCTGNICRSPLAEAWLQAEAPSGIKIESAGVGALVGHRADPMAIEVGKDNGLDLSKHKARQIEFGMLESFDLILTMELAHRNHLISIAPWATGKIWRWGHHENLDVPDPYRKEIEHFMSSFSIISRLGQNWLNLLKAL